METGDFNTINIGLGESANPMENDSRTPAVILRLIKSRAGKIIGLETIPGNDRGHCWCDNLLYGLRGCAFEANIQIGVNFIIIENETVDAGRLFWEIDPAILSELKIAIREIQIKSNLKPYSIFQLGGTEEMPFYDGFRIINESLIIEETELKLDDAFRKPGSPLKTKY